MAVPGCSPFVFLSHKLLISSTVRYYGNKSKANGGPLIIKTFLDIYLCSYHFCYHFPSDLKTSPFLLVMGLLCWIISAFTCLIESSFLKIIFISENNLLSLPQYFTPNFWIKQKLGVDQKKKKDWAIFKMSSLNKRGLCSEWPRIFQVFIPSYWLESNCVTHL